MERKGNVKRGLETKRWTGRKLLGGRKIDTTREKKVRKVEKYALERLVGEVLGVVET